MKFTSFCLFAIVLGLSKYSDSCNSGTSEPPPERCSAADEFLCKKSNECTFSRLDSRKRNGDPFVFNLLCDGDCDCERSRCEDENEACPNQACTGRINSFGKVAPMFQCRNGRCIGEDQECNGWNDCGDGSDERNCWRSGDCIVKRRERCDGVHQCRFNVDE